VLVAPPDPTAPPELVAPPERIAPPEPVAPPETVAPPEPFLPPDTITPPEPFVPPELPPVLVEPPTAGGPVMPLEQAAAKLATATTKTFIRFISGLLKSSTTTAFSTAKARPRTRCRQFRCLSISEHPSFCKTRRTTRVDHRRTRAYTRPLATAVTRRGSSLESTCPRRS